MGHQESVSYPVRDESRFLLPKALHLAEDLPVICDDRRRTPQAVLADRSVGQRLNGRDQRVAVGHPPDVRGQNDWLVQSLGERHRDERIHVHHIVNVDDVRRPYLGRKTAQRRWHRHRDRNPEEVLGDVAGRDTNCVGAGRQHRDIGKEPADSDASAAHASEQPSGARFQATEMGRGKRRDL